MKKSIIKLLFACSLLMSVGLFYSCDQSAGSTETENAKEHNHGGDANAADSKYICPMECEGSAQEAAGECPVCGMDLVLRSEL